MHGVILSADTQKYIHRVSFCRVENKDKLFLSSVRSYHNFSLIF